jgi:PIN domain nuclease of toxin-antitoxin system
MRILSESTSRATLPQIPQLHTDPFDRLLCAQAKAEGVPLMSGDAAVLQYPLDTIW